MGEEDGRELTEEGIAQGDLVDTAHIEVVEHVRVEVEEDGHVDGLAGVETLLLEAEALDLAEVGGDLGGGDAVGGDADDVGVAAVGGGVEGEGGLAR